MFWKPLLQRSVTPILGECLVSVCIGKRTSRGPCCPRLQMPGRPGTCAPWGRGASSFSSFVLFSLYVSVRPQWPCKRKLLSRDHDVLSCRCHWFSLGGVTLEEFRLCQPFPRCLMSPCPLPASVDLAGELAASPKSLRVFVLCCMLLAVLVIKSRAIELHPQHAVKFENRALLNYPGWA